MAGKKRLDRIFDGYFSMQAEDMSFHPVELAKRASLSVANLRKDIVCEQDILALFNNHLDQQASEAALEEDQGHAAMLEALCVRLEVSFPWRQGLISLRRRTRRQPLFGLRQAALLGHSMAWLSEIAGYQTGQGHLRDVQLVALYDRAIEVLGEDDEHLTRCLAVLDQGLKKIESRQKRFQKLQGAHDGLFKKNH